MVCDELLVYDLGPLGPPCGGEKTLCLSSPRAVNLKLNDC